MNDQNCHGHTLLGELISMQSNDDRGGIPWWWLVVLILFPIPFCPWWLGIICFPIFCGLSWAVFQEHRQRS